MNAPTNLSPQQLRQAADIQERILSLQADLSQLLSGYAMPTSRRRLSAQGLANIRAGARKRWGTLKSDSTVSPTAGRPRRRISAAGRAAIAARMRARWAAAKRSGRNAL